MLFFAEYTCAYKAYCNKKNSQNNGAALDQI